MTGSERLETTERCDVKVWSGSCEHATYANLSEKYLCDACGTISRLDHEVSHKGFIHIKGDEETVS
jgi:hypothetical protein